MCGQLGVSRGSFYWHFRDIADFRAQILEAWRERNTEWVIRDLETASQSDGGLARLLRRTFGVRRRLDQAVRTWGMSDETVAYLVATVDARRVSYLTAMMVKAGVCPELATGRATFLYWSFIGRSSSWTDIEPASLHELLSDIQRILSAS